MKKELKEYVVHYAYSAENIVHDTDLMPCMATSEDEAKETVKENLKGKYRKFKVTFAVEKSDYDARAKDRQYAAQRFGIPERDVLWYHSGICYDRVGVATQRAANAVTKKVEGQYVNGGMLHGMPLGGQTKSSEGYDVYC